MFLQLLLHRDYDLFEAILLCQELSQKGTCVNYALDIRCQSLLALREILFSAWE